MPSMSVITPTCNRPLGIVALERWMARQTVAPDEWIVADGGRAVPLQHDQRHLHDPSLPPGVANFHANLTRGLQAAQGDLIVIMEDDDWYASTHLAWMRKAFSRSDVTIAGDDQQRYYNLEYRCWRHMQNRGAALCQTGFVRALIPTVLEVLAERGRRVTSPDPIERRRAIGVDAYLWQSQPRDAWHLEQPKTVVGIKGIPGQVGLGIGHQRDRMRYWTEDPTGAKLAAWVGAGDAAWYRTLEAREASA